MHKILSLGSVTKFISLNLKCNLNTIDCEKIKIDFDQKWKKAIVYENQNNNGQMGFLQVGFNVLIQYFIFTFSR